MVKLFSVFGSDLNYYVLAAGYSGSIKDKWVFLEHFRNISLLYFSLLYVVVINRNENICQCLPVKLIPVRNDCKLLNNAIIYKLAHSPMNSGIAYTKSLAYFSRA